MKRQAKHDRHAFSAEEKIDILLDLWNRDFRDWLDDPKTEPARKARITQLLNYCQELVEILKGYPDSNWVRYVPITEAEKMPPSPDWDRCQELEESINRMLKRYRGYQVIGIRGVGAEIQVHWDQVGPISGQSASEWFMSYIIIDALQSGDLARLVKCGCGQYFFQRSSLSRFCSNKCRIGFWENSEVRKQQKRAKAREYYKLHKSGKVK